MKKIRIIQLGAILFLFVVFLLTALYATMLSASAVEKESDNNAGETSTVFLDSSENTYYDVERVSREMFGDKAIDSSEYLYNLDDSADFIYVDFAVMVTQFILKKHWNY